MIFSGSLWISALLALSKVVNAIPVEGQAATSRFTTYNLKTPATGPCDLERGPDDALWGQGILKNNIFRIDPRTGKIDEYPIPFTTPISNQTLPGVAKSITDRTALSCAIRRGVDGNLYAANGLRNQLVRINPTTKDIKVFQIGPVNPVGNLQPFNDLYSAKDGMWVTATTGNTFSFFSFATEKFTVHEVPTPLALPLGLFVASDGVVYVAEMLSNKILTYNPKTKVTKEYPLPEPLQLPTVIRAERNGYVFFAMFTGNGIGRISMKTGKIDLYPSGQLGGIGAEDTIDKYGGVWLSSFTTDGLSRLDTNTYKYSFVPFPDTFAAAGLPGVLGDIPPYVDVPVNYGPGDAIWFAGLLNNMVVRYDISGLYK